MDLYYIHEAYEYYLKNEEEVDALMNGLEEYSAPSKEIINLPDKWEGVHWFWFFLNYNMR